jgi:hypothetical protein
MIAELMVFKRSRKQKGVENIKIIIKRIPVRPKSVHVPGHANSGR